MIDVPRGIAALPTIDDRPVRQAEQIRELVIPAGVGFVWVIVSTCVQPNLFADTSASKGKDALSMDFAATNLDPVEWRGGAGTFGYLHVA